MQIAECCAVFCFMW